MARNRKGSLSISDRFAEALAASAWTEHDGNVQHAGRMIGIEPTHANEVMQRIRKSLGAEQCR